MVKNLRCLLLVLVNIPISSMEDDHHKKTRSRSGSSEFVTINILPPKETKKDEKFEIEDKKAERKNKLKIAAIAAASAVAAAGLTAAVTLTIHFTECNNPTNNP